MKAGWDVANVNDGVAVTSTVHFATERFFVPRARRAESPLGPKPQRPQEKMFEGGGFVHVQT